jgi:heptosyltransferase-3
MNNLHNHPIAQALKHSLYGNYPDLSNVQRCLIIKLAHIGDVLLTTPVFKCLDEYLQDRKLEVDVMVYNDTEPILRHNEFISKIHIVRRSKSKITRFKNEWKLLKAVRTRKYDLVLNMTTSDRGAIVGFASGARIRVSLDPRGKGIIGKHRLSTHLIRYPLKPRHAVERNLDFLRVIGIHPDASERQLYLDPGDEARNSLYKILNEYGIDVSEYSPIVVSPTTRWRFKSWRTNAFTDLIDYLFNKPGAPVVIVGGTEPLDLEISKEIISRCKIKPFDLTGKTTLLELSALLEKARLFVGVDSAPMHMAAAMKIPTVGIFGPTNIAEWAPWDNGAGYCKAVAMDELSCLPCDLAGCAKGKVSDCLVRLPVERVIKGINDVLDLP